MRKGWVWCGLCILLLGGRVEATTTDPAPGAEEQTKTRLAVPYLKIFAQTLEAARKTDTDLTAPPYDDKSFAAAKLERDRQLELCEFRTPEFKTQSGYVACRMDAIHAFSAAIALRNTSMVDALGATLSAISADADAGKLTATQAHDIYAEINRTYDSLFSFMTALNDYQVGARLSVEYKKEFDQAYDQAHKDMPDAALFDVKVETSQADARNEAESNCDNADSAAGKKAYTDCVLGFEKSFLDAIHWRDVELYNSFAATLRAALADIDKGHLSPAQFDAVWSVLRTDYDGLFDRQVFDYHTRLARPLAIGYATRFTAAYMVQAGWPPDASQPSYDAASLQAAGRQQTADYNNCRATLNPALTETANRECFIAVLRKWAAAIKLRDSALLEALVAADHKVSADMDAGHLNRWQADAVYNQLGQAFDSIMNSTNSAYLRKLNEPLVAGYVLRVDNDYLAAGGGAVDLGDQGFDPNAPIQAATVFDRDIQSCSERRPALKTQAAFWNCRTAAEQKLAAAVHLRDTLLQEKLFAVVHQAAADADEGKITTDQLTAILTTMGADFDLFDSETWRKWRAAHSVQP